MSCMQKITTHSKQPLTEWILRFASGFLFLAVLAGCQTTTQVDTWKPVRSQHKIQVHTVSWENESLQVIADWYTGDEKNWKEIANANPNILPSHLSPGDRVLIPSDLLKTRATMTKSFFEDWQRSAKRRGGSVTTKMKGEPAPLIVPKLHKLKQDEDGSEAEQPLDLKEPDDDGNDLELFGPK